MLLRAPGIISLISLLNNAQPWRHAILFVYSDHWPSCTTWWSTVGLTTSTCLPHLGSMIQLLVSNYMALIAHIVKKYHLAFNLLSQKNINNNDTLMNLIVPLFPELQEKIYLTAPSENSLFSKLHGHLHAPSFQSCRFLNHPRKIIGCFM